MNVPKLHGVDGIYLLLFCVTQPILYTQTKSSSFDQANAARVSLGVRRWLRG